MTPLQAKVQVFEYLRQAWLVGAATSSLQLLYEEVVADRPQGTLTTWGHLRWRHAGGEQRTLGNVNGHRRFTNFGIVTVEVYGASFDGKQAVYDAAEVVLQALQGNPGGGVVLRSARMGDLDREEDHVRVDVSAEFEYDQVRAQ